MIKLPLLVGFLGSLLLLQGCSSFNNASEQAANALTPYQSDIVQGNVVTREQFELLQVGMSRQQVRNILGTALLTSVFHADRWDYVFTLKRQAYHPKSARYRSSSRTTCLNAPNPTHSRPNPNS